MSGTQLQRTLGLGADLAVMSATTTLWGDSDILLGAAHDRLGADIVQALDRTR